MQKRICGQLESWKNFLVEVIDELESGFEEMLQSSVWEESNHSIICIRRDTVTASLIKSILVVICKGLWTTSWIFYKTWFSVL